MGDFYLNGLLTG